MTIKLRTGVLLGYSGAKLPSDGFSLIHPFNDVDGECELLIEAAGFRHLKKNRDLDVKIDAPASFSKEFNTVTNEDAICIAMGGQHIGYVNRGLIPTFLDWMNDSRIKNAWIDKINGTPRKPTAYVYVEISAK